MCFKVYSKPRSYNRTTKHEDHLHAASATPTHSLFIGLNFDLLSALDVFRQKRGVLLDIVIALKVAQVVSSMT